MSDSRRRSGGWRRALTPAWQPLLPLWPLLLPLCSLAARRPRGRAGRTRRWPPASRPAGEE